jgi:hypothetical protein
VSPTLILSFFSFYLPFSSIPTFCPLFLCFPISSSSFTGFTNTAGVRSTDCSKVKVKFTLEPYSFFNLGARWGWAVSVTSRPLFTPKKDPVPIVQEAGWAPGPVWTGAENLVPPPTFDARTVQPVASRHTD